MTRLEIFDQVCSNNERSDFEDYSGESAIEWLRGDTMVTGTFPNATKENNRIRRYAAKYPDEVQIVAENPDGSLVARFAKKYLHITKPAGRQLTDEERKIAAERLAKARASRTQTLAENAFTPENDT